MYLRTTKLFNLTLLYLLVLHYSSSINTHQLDLFEYTQIVEILNDIYAKNIEVQRGLIPTARNSIKDYTELINAIKRVGRRETYLIDGLKTFTNKDHQEFILRLYNLFKTHTTMHRLDTVPVNIIQDYVRLKINHYSSSVNKDNPTAPYQPLPSTSCILALDDLGELRVLDYDPVSNLFEIFTIPTTPSAMLQLNLTYYNLHHILSNLLNTTLPDQPRSNTDPFLIYSNPRYHGYIENHEKFVRVYQMYREKPLFLENLVTKLLSSYNDVLMRNSDECVNKAYLYLLENRKQFTGALLKETTDIEYAPLSNPTEYILKQYELTHRKLCRLTEDEVRALCESVNLPTAYAGWDYFMDQNLTSMQFRLYMYIVINLINVEANYRKIRPLNLNNVDTIFKNYLKELTQTDMGSFENSMNENALNVSEDTIKEIYSNLDALVQYKTYLDMQVVPTTELTIPQYDIPYVTEVLEYYSHPVLGTRRLIVSLIVLTSVSILIGSLYYSYRVITLERNALLKHVTNISREISKFNSVISIITPEVLVTFCISVGLAILALLVLSVRKKPAE